MCSSFCNGLEGGDYLGKLYVLELILHVNNTRHFHRHFRGLDPFGVLWFHNAFPRQLLHVFSEEAEDACVWCYL